MQKFFVLQLFRKQLVASQDYVLFSFSYKQRAVYELSKALLKKAYSADALSNTFIFGSGDILITTDMTGSGYKIENADDRPGKRADIAVANNAELNFYPCK